MALYVNLVSLTEQGIKTVRDTTRRAQAFRQMAAGTGVKVRDIYWTLGGYDVVAILEAPDDETVMSVLLSLGSLGNVRTQTLRAFSAEEMEKILAKMP